MTVLCAGDCHVWLGSSSLCMCEAHRVAMMYPFPMGYNPFSPHAPQKAPSTGSGRGALAPDVPEKVFEAAKAILGATHLSADGERVYIQKMGELRVCYWDEEAKVFGSSYPCPNGLPTDAVVIES